MTVPHTGMVAEDAAHLTKEMPNTVYEITVTNCDSRTSEEQYALAQDYAAILDVELAPEHMTQYDNETIEFGCVDGGFMNCSTTCHYYGAAFIDYYNNLQGQAVQVERIVVTENTDLSISYPLGGEDYTIGDAISFVEERWQQGLDKYSSMPDIQVERVIVCQREDGSYIYTLLLSHVYQGVPLEQYSTMAQISTEVGGFRKSYIFVEMDAPGHISAYSDNYPVQIVSVESIAEQLLTEAEAIARAQEVLAAYSSLTIQESQLCYAAYRNSPEDMSDEEWNTAEFVYRPYWCLVLEWGLDEDGNYYGLGWTNYTPNATLYVDAVTGTAYLLDSISYHDMEISD